MGFYGILWDFMGFYGCLTHRKTIGNCENDGFSWDFMDFDGIYPLVNVDITMENHHLLLENSS